ncbi:uncharacterized protein LOC128232926 [Mya arenaria]|uniref:uncharacterized protein LOC128232926 n=1 Tax=Mya arenaria TaxID=6604 RepID=UPI0022E4A038|nr:uncharacterized protein LOC128232926 [Mya arenaria]
MHAFFIFLLIGCLYDVTAPAPAPSGVHILDGLCLPKRTDRLLYRNRNDTHIYIAFDILKKGVVDVYSWKVLKSTKGTFISPEVIEETELAIDFRKRVNRDHIVGACGKRHQKTFKHRMVRKMEHCKEIHKRKGKYCKVKSVSGVYVRMKIRNVKFDVKEEDCSNNFS